MPHASRRSPTQSHFSGEAGKPRIRVFPTIDLLSDAAVTKAARDALFGSKMKVFPGGWSFDDRALLGRLAVVPPVVASADTAVQFGLRFMAEANTRWSKVGQSSTLLPTETALFRLAHAETQLISRGRRPIAWKVRWLVFANIGGDAERVDGIEDRFVPVEHAAVSLTVSLTGRIVGGSATWRPTGKPFMAEQIETPKALAAHLRAIRPRDGHGHGSHDGAAGHGSSPASGLEMRYAAAAKAEFCNFLDPRLRLFETGAHTHGPPLIVPMTDYGLNAEIISLARRANPGSRNGEIELHAWVTGCRGVIPMNPPPAGHSAHWMVVDDTAGVETNPRRYSGGGPLRLQGLGRVALTVSNIRGCIAHSHIDICSFLDPVDRQPGVA